jgi:hypothetical protein
VWAILQTNILCGLKPFSSERVCRGKEESSLLSVRRNFGACV